MKNLIKILLFLLTISIFSACADEEIKPVSANDSSSKLSGGVTIKNGDSGF